MSSKLFFVFDDILIHHLEAVKKFCVFADEKLPKLKNKKYIDYKLEPDEWQVLELIKEVLAVCDYSLICFINQHSVGTGATQCSSLVLFGDRTYSLADNSYLGASPKPLGNHASCRQVLANP